MAHDTWFDVVSRIIDVMSCRLSNRRRRPGSRRLQAVCGRTRCGIEWLEDRALLTALVSLSSPATSFAENGGAANVTATLSEPQDHDVFVNLSLGGTAVHNSGYRATSSAAPITVDGNFNDWLNNPNVVFGTDPFDDTHDTDTTGADNSPLYVNHPDVDLREFAVTHDDENIYFYFKATGQIGRTQVADPALGKRAGRYYAIVTTDVDQNDVTGYPLHEGGYYPTTGGYDMNAEIEYFNGVFNTGHYLNHGATDLASLNQAFADQSHGGYNPAQAGLDIQGPFQPGFLNILPGTYDYYSQWVYKNNDPALGGSDSITFVKDKGPIVEGIIQQAISADGHEMEMIVPYKGFLVDASGNPVVDVGSILDLSFSLEASNELAPGGQWASDTADPLNGYHLRPSSEVATSVIRIPAGQTSASLTVTGLPDAVYNPNRNAVVSIQTVVGAAENGNQELSLAVQNDDPPAISATQQPLTYVTLAPPVAADPGLTVSAPSGALCSGAVVSFTSGFVSGQDSLTFTNQNGISGLYNPVNGTLMLSGAASVSRYEEALRSVLYQNAAAQPAVSAKTIQFQLSGDGLTSTTSRQVTVVTPNIAPQIVGFDTSAIHVPATPPVVLDLDVTITDIDSPNFAGGALTVALITNAHSADRLEIRNQGLTAGLIGVNGTSVSWGGLVIGTLSGGAGATPLSVLLNEKATPAAVQALLRNITFRTVTEAPSTLSRTVRVTLTDGDGGTSNQPTKTISVAARNDAPVITAFDTTVTYKKKAAPVVLDTNAVVNDVDSGNLSTGKLTVRISLNRHSSDRLSIRNQGTGTGQIGVSGTSISFGGMTIGSFTGGTGSAPLVVSFNINATPAAAQAVLRNLTFDNQSTAPSLLTRTLEVSLTDGDGGISSIVKKQLQVVL